MTWGSSALRTLAANVALQSKLQLLRSVTKSLPFSSGLLGADGENVAACYLRKQGYRILARGHRQRLGEVDLIALDGSVIVFVEVKTWRSGSAGDPSQAVDARKQERLTRAALIYLKRRKLLDHAARFDVVSRLAEAPHRTRDSSLHQRIRSSR